MNPETLSAKNPDATVEEQVSVIKMFIAEGRPLIKEREEFLKANPDLFTDEERATYLPWKGAIGGQTSWLQLGIGWYKNPAAGDPTPIPEGMFNPYGFASTDEVYAAYKLYRQKGGLPQDEDSAEKET